MIAGQRIEGPLPILTSREVNALERCKDYIRSGATFDEYQMYTRISVIGQVSPSRTGIIDYSKIDVTALRKNFTDKIEADLAKSPSSTIIKSWHPQIASDQLTQVRRKHIFDISLNAGANLIEGRMLETEKVENYLKWMKDAQSTAGTKTVVTTMPAKLHPSVFEKVVSKQLDNGNRMFMAIGAALSNLNTAMNYSYMKTQTPTALFIAAEVSNGNSSKKGKAGPVPFRGMEIVRNYGTWAFFQRVGTPPYTDKGYTAQSARRLDHVSGGFKKLNSSEHYGLYHSLDLACDCPACEGKDASDFYGWRRNGLIYSGLDTLHAAFTLPSLVKPFRKPTDTEDVELKSSNTSSGVSDEI